MSFLLFLVVLSLPVFYGIHLYNKLVRGRNQFKNAFSQIDVQLQRRFELIPNLVEIAKKYMNHEQETLQQVIAARQGAEAALKDAKKQHNSNVSMRNLIKEEQVFEASLSRLMMVAEAYPDLKANHTMSGLMEELSSTENKVSFARQAYNDAVMHFNNDVQSFPSNILAGLFGFSEAVLYIVSETVKKPVQVSFE